MAVVVAAKPDDIGDPASRMLRSWDRNAPAWTYAVREQRIASRRAGTDAAIVDAVLASGAKTVLDVGCGEGWLARVLATHGCRVVGIDASEALIASAQRLGGGMFAALAYRELGDRAIELGAPFDLVVCNFSLLEEDLAPVLAGSRIALRDGARLLVQTVHPWLARGDGAYVDGWRVETFDGFGAGFVEPMPWYFRTLASWVHAIDAAGFVVTGLDEPIDAASGRPLSLLIAARAGSAAD